MTGAGGGDTVRRGVGRAAGKRAPRASGGREGLNEHLLQVEARTALPPHSGRKSYSKEASRGDRRNHLEAPPPSPGSETGKSCQAPGPASRGVPPAPSPPAAEAGAAPPPARRPLSRPAGRALGLLVPRPESRRLPFPRLPSRAARPLLPRPLQQPQFTHTASGPALTLPHSHTQRDHGS